jgi:hypothetical protein
MNLVMPQKAMFGFGEILVIAAFGWLVTKVLRVANREKIDSSNRQVPPPDPGTPVQRSRTEELGPGDRSSATQTSPPRAVPPAAPPTRDEQIAELRRRYVADEITVEEYESELDRLLKAK